jgi:hypothetical protein
MIIYYAYFRPVVHGFDLSAYFNVDPIYMYISYKTFRKLALIPTRAVVCLYTDM